MENPLNGLAGALIGMGIVGIIGATIMVKLGYGRPLYDAVSKASRKAVGNMTKRFQRRN